MGGPCCPHLVVLLVSAMIFILKVQTQNAGIQFVNLAHVTNSVDLFGGKVIRLMLISGNSVEVSGKSAELVRSHLDGMAIDLTGAPQDRNSALEEC